MIDMIRIAEDFSKLPGGRYPSDGDGNGEDFREKFLVPVLDNNGTAAIILDGTRGYPSSFLEEAFGGLVRKGYTVERINAAFSFVAEQKGFARFVGLIQQHIDRAGKTSQTATA
jgi:hypothetical protein